MELDEGGKPVDGTPVRAAGDAPAQERDGAQRTGPYRPGYELVAEQILQLIAELRLQPGDRMPTENDLAARLGTSRTVVREAIKILSAIGRVRAQKGRGLYVADDEGMLGSSRWEGFFLPTDLDHVYMLFEFRRVQETAASRLAATRATPTELRAIEAAAETCRQGHVTGQAALFDQGDDDFHLGIATASHNPFLLAAVREARRLQHQSSTIGLRGTVGGHAEEAVQEHTAIYQAIRDGDPDGAAHAAAVHLDNTLEDYRREIQRRVFG
ncbi:MULTISPECIES: FadR/GntR family transcriptional regulator [Actinoallomurus]|uniref:FadR/GntR family transcriptional regulator n=1 Tax=Actinoallomurus TaxID=667113 RepID=UPI002E30DFD5|nr:FadR/GntR family transcriptional regulator [Actinoallomurus sp. NBC_01490]